MRLCPSQYKFPIQQHQMAFQTDQTHHYVALQKLYQKWFAGKRPWVCQVIPCWIGIMGFRWFPKCPNNAKRHPSWQAGRPLSWTWDVLRHKWIFGSGMIWAMAMGQNGRISGLTATETLRLPVWLASNVRVPTSSHFHTCHRIGFKRKMCRKPYMTGMWLVNQWFPVVFLCFSLEPTHWTC